MCSLRSLLSLVLWLGYLNASTDAFTALSQRASNGEIRIMVGTRHSLALGPVARNGLAYEDVTLGQGRRILPGDTVYCYYIGSFRKGAFGGPTVFDQTSTSECLISLF